jgi:outer membrane lipoprotein SlyB
MSSPTREDAQFRAQRTAAKYHLKGAKRQRAVARGLLVWSRASGATRPARLSGRTRDLIMGIAAAAIGGVIANAITKPPTPVMAPNGGDGSGGGIFDLFGIFKPVKTP